MARIKLGKSSLFRLFGAIVAVYIIVTVVVPLLTHLRKRFTVRKKSVPYVKSVAFKCSHLRKGGSHFNLVPHIRFRLYIIAHNDFSVDIAQQWSRCMPFVEILRIENTPFFESYAYATILSDKERQKEWSELDFVGLATYKSLKFLSIEKLEAYLQLAYYSPFDFIPLYNTGENLLQQAVRGHTQEFKGVWDATLSAYGFTAEEIRSGDDIEVFLRNTFITTPHWMVELCAFMNRYIHIASTNETLGLVLASNSHYREAKLHVARIVFHENFYHWHPFIFERLTPFFVHIRNISVFGSLYQTEWFENTNISTDGLYKGL
jgi:hypothetical protein